MLCFILLNCCVFHRPTCTLTDFICLEFPSNRVNASPFIFCLNWNVAKTSQTKGSIFLLYTAIYSNVVWAKRVLLPWTVQNYFCAFAVCIWQILSNCTNNGYNLCSWSWLSRCHYTTRGQMSTHLFKMKSIHTDPTHFFTLQWQYIYSLNDHLLLYPFLCMYFKMFNVFLIPFSHYSRFSIIIYRERGRFSQL